MIRRGDLNDVMLLQRIGRKTFDDAFGNTCTREDMRGVLDVYFNSAQVAEELLDATDNFFFLRRMGLRKGICESMQNMLVPWIPSKIGNVLSWFGCMY